MEEKHIELIARAVVVDGDNILLCKQKAADYFYFLPGGHVEFDEDIATALKREIKEEMDVDIVFLRFIGVWENEFFENSFQEKPEQKHELNIIFEAKLASQDIKNMEDHIECRWVPLEEFKKAKVLPELLKEKVVEWMGNREVFFGGEKHNTELM